MKLNSEDIWLVEKSILMKPRFPRDCGPISIILKKEDAETSSGIITAAPEILMRPTAHGVFLNS